MAAAVQDRAGAPDDEGEQGRFGVVGLGAGSLACYSRKQARRGASSRSTRSSSTSRRESELLHLPRQLPAQARRVIGDARLTVAKEPDKSFDLIIVDAFTSDAVPVHLMTAEALQLYAGKLKRRRHRACCTSPTATSTSTSVLGATCRWCPELQGPHRLRRQGRRQLRAEHIDHRRVRQERATALDPFRALDGARTSTPAACRRGRTMPPISWARSCRSGVASLGTRRRGLGRSCARPPPELRVPRLPSQSGVQQPAARSYAGRRDDRPAHRAPGAHQDLRRGGQGRSRRSCPASSTGSSSSTRSTPRPSSR